MLLYNLTQYQLSHTLMPVGAYNKDEIRQIAEKIGLQVAHKKDSQEICFVPDKDYAGFIEEKHKSEDYRKETMCWQMERVIGEHKGITHYTIGQRKGLNLAIGHPVFVTGICPKTNEVVIGESEDLFKKELVCQNINFMAMEDLPKGEERRVLAKIRYNHQGSMCTIRRTGEDEITAIFDEPQRAITPGQAVVFYENGYVAGGGTIINNTVN